MARLLSVNVGLLRDIAWQGRTVHTAVWKAPVQGRRIVRRLNIDGDGQGDLAGHGGEHRAVFVYQMASYRYWQDRLGRSDFTYGQFGENLTVDGLPDDEVCIGDHYRIGSALFEVTQPRVTCYYLERENGSDGRQRRRGRRLDCGAHLGPRRVRHLRYPSGSTLSKNGASLCGHSAFCHRGLRKGADCERRSRERPALLPARRMLARVPGRPWSGGRGARHHIRDTGIGPWEFDKRDADGYRVFAPTADQERY
jgi:hypothetical protein